MNRGEHGKPWNNNKQMWGLTNAEKERAIACVNALDGIPTEKLEKFMRLVREICLGWKTSAPYPDMRYLNPESKKLLEQLAAMMEGKDAKD